jgi:hypothetical protein
MSFFSSIGNFFSKATSVVDTVTKIADKVTSFIKAPLDMITKPLQGALDGLADKLPFGLGKVVKPFVDKFLPTALSWLAGGPLGGFFGMLTKIAPTAEKIDSVLDTVDGAMDKGIGGLSDLAKQNLTNGTAWTQAQSLLSGIF